MKKFCIVVVCLVLFNFVSSTAHSQATAQPPPVLLGNIWVDLFGGQDGAVIYPQYSFKVNGPRVVITGFGFWERAPNEPDFSNHVNTFTWAKILGLSLRTEVGGRVREFNTLPPAGFVQIAPQVNVHKLFRLKGVDYLVASYLPALVGIRTSHTLIAGGTQKLQLGSGVAVSVEGYRRLFPDNPDYTEVWVLASVEWLKFTPAVFVIVDGKEKIFAVGGRFAVK